MLLGAVVAAALCLGGIPGAVALSDPNGDTAITPLGQIDLKEKDYSATLVVVSESGAESIAVSRSDLTVASVLKSRGYESDSFKDDKGNQIALGQRLENGQQVVVYSSTVAGTSETIELKLPDERTEDPNLYEGQTVVADPGKIGSALKTTIIHRDLSKMPLKPDALPESLDPAALSSEATQTGEEVYITVLDAPLPKKYTAGTKPCGSPYLCELIKSGGLAAVAGAGAYVHPLGSAKDWTTYHGSRGHEGGAVDFPVPSETPIYAVADGVVVDSGWLGGGGNMVTIRHADGTLSAYAHMVETPLVRAGMPVAMGQIIGFVGSTGNSTGPHLHFEIFKAKIWGETIPAYEYMKLHGVVLGSCVDGPCELSQFS